MERPAGSSLRKASRKGLRSFHGTVGMCGGRWPRSSDLWIMVDARAQHPGTAEVATRHSATPPRCGPGDPPWSPQRRCLHAGSFHCLRRSYVAVPAVRRAYRPAQSICRAKSRSANGGVSSDPVRSSGGTYHDATCTYSHGLCSGNSGGRGDRGPCLGSNCTRGCHRAQPESRSAGAPNTALSGTAS
jgi:hypothetical protein